MTPRAAGTAFAVAALLLGAAPPAAAQEAPPDSARAAAPGRTAETAPMRVEEVAPGPLSPGARLVFTRDSLIWVNGYTLADLLSEVPGVYVARTGFAGQPTPALYGGRGTAGLEILYDGVPMAALGPDSLAVDPGRISLIGIRRVEVERHPAFLRVYLVSERHERLGARSYLRIMNGDFSTAGYAGVFQYRWRNGLGLDLSADYLNAKGGQGVERDARWFDMRAAVDWSPTPLLSASYQLRTLTLDREATVTATGLRIPLREDGRRESLLRLVASTRPERKGWSIEAGLVTSTWRADSGTVDTLLGERSMTRAFGGVRYADRGVSLDLTARVSDYHTPLDVELQAGWLPLSWLVVSGNGRLASHRDDRSSRTAWGSIGVYRGAFSLVGDVRWTDAVATPVLSTDTAQSTLDLGARAGLQARKLTVHAGVEQRDPFAPPDLGIIPDLPPLLPSPRATFAIADLTVNLGPLSVSGWIAEPVAGSSPSFEPPRHARAAFTFRSRFLRTFRSGAFDLKVQLAMESWSEGVAGTDASGFPVPLPGATITEAFLQFEIASFHAFYSLKNALRSQDGFVPGFEFPRNLQTFGVKWVFRD